ncbi:MAG: phosphopantetheine-binding protein [Polyangiaceae bacterium]
MSAETDVDGAALEAALKQMIVEELDLRDHSPDDIDSAAPLFGSGLGLDSLDALQLVMAVEERFGVQIPEGEEARGALASVAALARYVREHGGDEPR